jgi:hypothetical protein
MEAHDTSRGAVIRLFGVILVILGTLDSMLMWRGGFVLSNVYVGMIVSGLFLYVIGTIRRRNGVLTQVKAGPEQPDKTELTGG